MKEVVRIKKTGFEDATNLIGNTQIGDGVDNSAGLDNDTNATKKAEEDATNKAANATPKYDSNTGAIIDGSETVSAFDVGKFMNKPILDVLGLSKKAREKRKAKRTEKVKSAREAEGKGEETYKQANKRDARKAKKKAEDIKKRDEYKANLKTKKAAPTKNYKKGYYGL